MRLLFCHCGSPTMHPTGTCDVHRRPSALERMNASNLLGKDDTGRAVDTIWDYFTGAPKGWW
jgi:hypothetical protein